MRSSASPASRSTSPASPDPVALTRDGLTWMLLLLALAAVGFGVALARRSWPTWLLALSLTVASLGVAYTHRADATVPPSGAAR